MSSDATNDELHRRLFDEGIKVRKDVLGSEYVENALRNATPFTRPGQELITEWAWGTVWQRPGLDRKQRSLLTLGLIIGQKAWLELGLHTRGAINNGVTELEIREAVLHAAVYCGTPSCIEAMIVTQKTINDMVDKGEYKRPEN
ncbi:carboxymuconolactone decarboxylase family protein [Metarhizium robertsii]|uniref:Nitrosuccinic acid decarboxylase npaB n=2 Tax=Metarhizium robertsii TaxID=568076 RepID=NPAB_METRA|nr:4-carboxymuconolactone decarboxylase [Metarhizium robertsii ARSEF 23]EFY96726.1 4-carboxymuconolactone decarboxylase [Metarhizium robertsii ARSEF 23]EXU97731.1 carboxymuconolactone decarboxylase family protein [Metarhizium robertsii]